MDIDSTVRALFSQLKARVEEGGEGLVYGNRTRALNDLDALLSNPSIEGVGLLLAPTGNLQELSIEYGWGEEFLDLAARIELALGIT